MAQEREVWGPLLDPTLDKQFEDEDVLLLFHTLCFKILSILKLSHILLGEFGF